MPREFREYREIDEEEDERNDPERRALRPQMSEAEVWERCLAEARRDLEEHPPTEEERRQRDALLAELDAESNLEPLAGAPMEPTTSSKVALSEDEQAQLDAKMAELSALSDEELPLSRKAQEAHSADSRRSLVLGDSDQIRLHSSEVQERREAVAAEVHAEEAKEEKEQVLDFESARAGLQALVAVEAVGLRPTLEELVAKGELAGLGVDGVLTLLQERELLEGKSGEEVVLAVHAIEGLDAFGLLNQLERQSFESLRTHLTRRLGSLEVERQESPSPQIPTPKENGWRWDSLAAEVALRVLDILEVVGLQPTLEEMAERGALAEQGAAGVFSHLNREGLLAESRDEEGVEGVGRRLRWVVDSLELLERMGLLAWLDRASWGEVREELVRLRAGTFSMPPEHLDGTETEGILRTQAKEGRVPVDWAVTELLEPLRRWEDLVRELPRTELGEKLLAQWGKQAWTQLEAGLARHPYFQERNNFEKRYKDSLWYLTLREVQEHDRLTELTFAELARSTGISKWNVRRWLTGETQPPLFGSLRAHEEARRAWEAHIGEARHRYIAPSRVYVAFKTICDSPEQRNSEVLAVAIAGLLCDVHPDSPRIIVAALRPYHETGPKWLREVAGAITDKRKEIEQLLNRRLGLDEDSNKALRLGVINDTLYLWRRDTSDNNWLNLYAQEHFYFVSIEEKKRFVHAARSQLGIDGNINLSLLVSQITDYTGSLPNPPITAINDFLNVHTYLSGETLHFLLDVTGKSLTDIQLHIHHIGKGSRGRGHILNPQFPEIEPLRTRLLATMFSDGHIEQQRTLSYSESDPDRLARVKELILQLGDLEIGKRKYSNGSIGIFLSPVLGRLLERWGMPVGDKALQEIRIPSFITDGTPEIKGAYLEELIPEDGSFSHDSYDRRRFQWSRAVVLCASEKKGESYGFEPRVSPDDIDFIRRFGTTKTKTFGKPDRPAEIIIRIQWGTLARLAGSDNVEVAATAQRLKQRILDNPCRLLEDEVGLCESLGIKIIKYPAHISLFESGRVSVQWQAQTSAIEDTMRFALLAPPDDKHKRAQVEAWLARHPERAKTVVGQMRREGLEPKLFDEKMDDL